MEGDVIESETHDENEQIKEVYARYGLAIYHIQCLERALGIALVSVFGPGPKKITKSQYDQLLESNFKKTLGQLTSKLKQINVSQPFIKELIVCLEQRNWLVHHYFWDRCIEIQTQVGRNHMISELNDISAKLNNVDSYITEMTDKWAISHGLKPEDYQKALDNWIVRK